MRWCLIVTLACVLVTMEQGIQVRDDNARTYMHNKVRLHAVAIMR